MIPIMEGWIELTPLTDDRESSVVRLLDISAVVDDRRYYYVKGTQFTDKRTLVHLRGGGNFYTNQSVAEVHDIIAAGE